MASRLGEWIARAARAAPPNVWPTPNTPQASKVLLSHARGATRLNLASACPAAANAVKPAYATAEPVFANLRRNNWMSRFTLRGTAKERTQWKLFCLAHSIEKLEHSGWRR